jgi:hypothetical protein
MVAIGGRRQQRRLAVAAREAAFLVRRLQFTMPNVAAFSQHGGLATIGKTAQSTKLG